MLWNKFSSSFRRFKTYSNDFSIKEAQKLFKFHFNLLTLFSLYSVSELFCQTSKAFSFFLRKQPMRSISWKSFKLFYFITKFFSFFFYDQNQFLNFNVSVAKGLRENVSQQFSTSDTRRLWIFAWKETGSISELLQNGGP